MAPCDTAETTLGLRQCLSTQIESAQLQLKRYSTKARRLALDTALFDSAQVVWQRYRDAACLAAGSQYEGGSLQLVVILACRLAMIRDRTHQLWGDFLQPDDSLPEPR